MPQISLSSIAIEPDLGEAVVLAGSWCLNHITERDLNRRGVQLEIAPSRRLSADQYRSEAEQCFCLYKKYVNVLSKELNSLHGTSYSLRYWETLLNRFLYPLTATVVDKHATLIELRERWPNAVLNVVNVEAQWMSPHTIPSFGSSRLLHLILYSIIGAESGILPCKEIEDKKVLAAISIQGDGKKESRGGNSVKRTTNQQDYRTRLPQWLMIFLRALKRRELPFFLMNCINPKIIALGGQYLKRQDFDTLMILSKTLPFYFQSNGWGDVNFASYDVSRREALRFPEEESTLEKSLQATIRRLLPTVFLENYGAAKEFVSNIVPKSPKLILNSQNHSGGEFVDFFIAHVVEERQAKHMMVCHGGCYGAMEISIQEQIWARVSDAYAIWSNPRVYAPNCNTIKLPSLRFHKWLPFRKAQKSGSQILLLLTGYYPQRYAYNSIYPYTIDDEYDDWQIRFLSLTNEQYRTDIVVRDYHRSSDISRGAVRRWAEEHGIEVNAEPAFEHALQESKIAIHTVPQTTYLETLSANHPTLCFWNPETNLIRSDLMPYFEGLVRAGVLHLNPESAAIKLNEIASDPLQWWNLPKVKSAVKVFRDNVCHTSHAALAEWAAYINNRKMQ